MLTPSYFMHAQNLNLIVYFQENLNFLQKELEFSLAVVHRKATHCLIAILTVYQNCVQSSLLLEIASCVTVIFETAICLLSTPLSLSFAVPSCTFNAANVNYQFYIYSPVKRNSKKSLK